MIRADVSHKLGNGCLVCGNPEKFIGPSVVSYLDILGMSAALIQDWGAHETSALHKLLRIKSSLPKDDPKTQISLILVDRETERDLEQYLTITRTLSDSVVTMAALPNECEWESFYLRVYSVLFSIRLIWQQAIREGFTLRGVIELGEMFWNESEFTGPALVKAYQLEKGHVDTSRVIVGPALLSSLLKAANDLLSGLKPGVSELWHNPAHDLPRCSLIYLFTISSST
jgi:hypothetical protein